MVIPIIMRMVKALQFLFFVVLTFAFAISLSACSKKAEESPKSAEQLKTEKTATDKTVRDNAVYGKQLKALDKAKDVQKVADEQAAETAKKIDEATK